MASQHGGQAQAQHYDTPPSPTTSSGRAPSPPHQSFYVQALYAYSGVDTSSLSFRQGDIIEVLSTLASGWWDGVICDQKIRGWFPSNYVQKISDEEAAWAREQMMGWWEGDEDEANNRRSSVASASGVGASNGFTGGVVTDYAGTSGLGTLEDFMTAADLTSFSNGGDIFGEIAAAAHADSSRPSSSSEDVRRSIYATASDSLRPLDDDEHEEDFWIPKVSRSGQLFYFNSRTGETSRDMPIDGRGDGVRIDASEFAPDDEDVLAFRQRDAQAPTTTAEWTRKTPADGSRPYWENTRTGERSWDTPTAARLASGLHPSRNSTGDASLLSAWTERPSAGDTLNRPDTLRRVSVYSDDSALDGAFGRDMSPRKEAKGKEVDHSAANDDLQRKEKRRSKQKSRKATSTADLLDPSPPPLINELETLVMVALQELINGAGIGGMVRRSGDMVDPNVERDRLAGLGDKVVDAVRTLLHASGVLEQAIVSSVASTPSSPNEILGSFTRSPTLPLDAQAELRPYTRRVTSTLSKLVLSVRAVWGILETIADDQILDVDDSPADEEELLRREQLREHILDGWARARETRFETEAKLRSEVLAGARDVQSNVLSFLGEFERVVGAGTAANGGPPLPRNLLRAPKALQGSLRTNAAALLLPGGGFGGNWRGNGFVTLPTPNSTPNLPSTGASATLSYAYPSQPISKELAASLQKDSQTLLDEGEALRSVIDSISTPKSTPSGPRVINLTDSSLTPTQLLDRAAQLQRRIATFLSTVEDIDVAAGVDFELTGDAASRPSSRRDVVSASESVSTLADSAKSSDVESLLDPSASEYRSSVLEARPLLADLEVRKQALYDVAPRLLLALQELYISARDSTSPVSGPQPLATSPFALFVPPKRVEYGPETIFEILADLSTNTSSLCTAVTSLAAIADVQAAAPVNLRQSHLAFRSSLFDSHTSPSTSSLAESRFTGKSNLGAHSPNSSRQSLTRTDDDHVESQNRDSVDSDFFFSGSTPAVRNKTSSKQLHMSPSSSWDPKRRGSVATSTTTATTSSSQTSLTQSYQNSAFECFLPLLRPHSLTLFLLQLHQRSSAPSRS